MLTDSDQPHQGKSMSGNVWLVGYHLLTWLLIWGAAESGGLGRGPCDVPFGLLLLPLFALVAIVLCIVGIRRVVRDPSDKFYLLFNLVALAIWIIVFVSVK